MPAFEHDFLESLKTGANHKKQKNTLSSGVVVIPLVSITLISKSNGVTGKGMTVHVKEAGTSGRDFTFEPQVEIKRAAKGYQRILKGGFDVDVWAAAIDKHYKGLMDHGVNVNYGSSQKGVGHSEMHETMSGVLGFKSPAKIAAELEEKEHGEDDEYPMLYAKVKKAVGNSVTGKAVRFLRLYHNCLYYALTEAAVSMQTMPLLEADYVRSVKTGEHNGKEKSTLEGGAVAISLLTITSKKPNPDSPTGLGLIITARGPNKKERTFVFEPTVKIERTGKGYSRTPVGGFDCNLWIKAIDKSLKMYWSKHQ